MVTAALPNMSLEPYSHLTFVFPITRSDRKSLILDHGHDIDDDDGDDDDNDNDIIIHDDVTSSSMPMKLRNSPRSPNGSPLQRKNSAKEKKPRSTACAICHLYASSLFPALVPYHTIVSTDRYER
jgi:hypothetical protein